MCGITGIIAKPGSEHSAAVTEMTNALTHRGPDAGGFHFDPDHGVFLGHRRLSIIDLQERANQPMHSPDGRQVLVYNGEIYNFIEIREELEGAGCEFRTTSDTEVVLHAYRTWGESCFSRFRGMFAVAIYDYDQGILLLARDPLGIKPLYYLEHAGLLAFSSEARTLWKSLRGVRDFSLNHDNVDQMLSFGYLPDPAGTMVDGVRKLAPGTTLTFDGQSSRSRTYWTLTSDPTWEQIQFEEGCERFDDLFARTMKIMVRSDVPISFLLSGGVDSSFLVGVAKHLGHPDLRTFTASFGHELDETEFAHKVAQHCGSDHHDFVVEVGDAQESFLDIIAHYDDLSSSDGGLFTTALISREITRRGVKVAFVGEGSDEVFGGYSWYGLAQAPFKWLPLSLRALGHFYAVSRMMQPKRLHHADIIAQNYREAGDRDICRQVTSHEVRAQLPNHLLQKVDRATMSASLEARVPFMDHEVVQAIYSMPLEWKRRGKFFQFGAVQEKVLLRTVAQRYVPREIAWRKKRGFMLPIADMIIENREFVRDALLASDGVALEFATRRELERIVGFRKTMYHPIEKQKECLVWRLLLLSLWHRSNFKT